MPYNIPLFCILGSYDNTLCLFNHLFYHTYASLPVKMSHFLSHSCLCITLNHLSNFLFLSVIMTQIWRFRVFSPVSTHLGIITLAPVVHFKISPLRIHLIPCTLSIQWWHCGSSGSAAAAASSAWWRRRCWQHGGGGGSSAAVAAAARRRQHGGGGGSAEMVVAAQRWGAVWRLASAEARPVVASRQQ